MRRRGLSNYRTRILNSLPVNAHWHYLCTDPGFGGLPMASSELNGKKIAILVADGFEQVEMTKPRQALEKAGAEVDLISPAKGKVRGFNHDDPGEQFQVDVPLKKAKAEDYDALVLPGGVANPDKLRIDEQAVQFISEFVAARKPIAAICHGPWPLIEVGAVRGRRMTSWPSLKTDLRNAGANWVDEQVVEDDGLVTSRKPDDIPAFNKKMIELFSQGGNGHGRSRRERHAATTR
jgi:protease I